MPGCRPRTRNRARRRRRRRLRRSRAKNSAFLPPPEPHRSLAAPPRLDWTDAEQAREWLAAIRGAADDLAVLAREGGRRRKDRYFSRGEHRRQRRAVEDVMRELLAEAAAGLVTNAHEPACDPQICHAHEAPSARSSAS